LFVLFLFEQLGMAPRSPNPAGFPQGGGRGRRPRPPSAPRTAGSSSGPSSHAAGSVSAPATPNPAAVMTTPPPKRASVRAPVVSVGATSILTIGPPFALAITAALPSKPAGNRVGPPSPAHTTPSTRPFIFQLPERLPPWSSFNVANYATTAAINDNNAPPIPSQIDKVDTAPILGGHGLTVRYLLLLCHLLVCMISCLMFGDK
jgi:hypothetical protein